MAEIGRFMPKGASSFGDQAPAASTTLPAGIVSPATVTTPTQRPPSTASFSIGQALLSSAPLRVAAATRASTSLAVF